MGVEWIRKNKMLNIYKFELPLGMCIVCAKNKNEAIDIFWNGDGRKQEICGKEYFQYDDPREMLDDDEPFLIDITKPHIIGFNCG